MLSVSDISVERWPASPVELLAGLTQLRAFGLRRTMAMTAPGTAAPEAAAPGAAAPGPVAAGQRAAARLLLRQVNTLWRRRIIDYVLLRAVRP